MDAKVLVAYASVMGSTTGIAKAIGDEIRAGSAVVDVLPVNQVSRIDVYRSVVLGSPIYEGHWLEQAVVFLEQHRDSLKKIPVAFFAVCTNLRETAEERGLRMRRYSDYIRQRAGEIQPVDIGIFTGSFNSKQWQLPTLLALKAKGELPLDGDTRDWNAIRAWAVEIRPQIIPQVAATS